MDLTLWHGLAALATAMGFGGGGMYGAWWYFGRRLDASEREFNLTLAAREAQTKLDQAERQRVFELLIVHLDEIKRDMMRVQQRADGLQADKDKAIWDAAQMAAELALRRNNDKVTAH